MDFKSIALTTQHDYLVNATLSRKLIYNSVKKIKPLLINYSIGSVRFSSKDTVKKTKKESTHTILIHKEQRRFTRDMKQLSNSNQLKKVANP